MEDALELGRLELAGDYEMQFRIETLESKDAQLQIEKTERPEMIERKCSHLVWCLIIRCANATAY